MPGATATRSSATAATSSRSCCPAPTPPGAMQVAERARQAVKASGAQRHRLDRSRRRSRDDGSTAGGRPARRGPGLLRGQARRPRPHRHRRRGPRPRRRVLAPGTDAGRPAEPSSSTDARNHGSGARCVTMDQTTRVVVAPALRSSLTVLATACVPEPANRLSPSAGGRRGVADTDPDARRTDPDPVVRPPDTDPWPDVRRSTRSRRGDTLVVDRQAVRDRRPQSIAYWNRVTYPSLDPDSNKYGRTGSRSAGSSRSSRARRRPRGDPRADAQADPAADAATAIG